MMIALCLVLMSVMNVNPAAAAAAAPPVREFRRIPVVRHAAKMHNVARYGRVVGEFFSPVDEGAAFDLSALPGEVIPADTVWRNGYSTYWNAGSFARLRLGRGKRVRGSDDFFSYLDPTVYSLRADAAVELPCIVDHRTVLAAAKLKGKTSGYLWDTHYCYAFVHGYLAEALRRIYLRENLETEFEDGVAFADALGLLLGRCGIDRLNGRLMEEYHPLIVSAVIDRLLTEEKHEAVTRILDLLGTFSAAEFARYVTPCAWMPCDVGGEKAFRDYCGGSGPVPGLSVYEVVLDRGNYANKFALLRAARTAGGVQVIESLLSREEVLFPGKQRRVWPEVDNATVLHEVCRFEGDAEKLREWLAYCRGPLDMRTFTQRDATGRTPLAYLQAAYPDAAELHAYFVAGARSLARPPAMANRTAPLRYERGALIRSLLYDCPRHNLTAEQIQNAVTLTAAWTADEIIDALSRAKLAGVRNLRWRHVTNALEAVVERVRTRLHTPGVELRLPTVPVRSGFERFPGLPKKIYQKLLRYYREALLQDRRLPEDRGRPIGVRGFTLVGPYGVGKSSIAWVMSTCGFIVVKPEDFDHVTDAVRLASTVRQPVILFLDEVEALAPHGSGKASRVRTLLESPGLDLSRVVVICTTNHPERVDGGIFHRFGKEEVPFPERSAREDIWARHLGDMERVGAADVDAAALARASKEMTGRDCEAVCTGIGGDGEVSTAVVLAAIGERYAAIERGELPDDPDTNRDRPEYQDHMKVWRALGARVAAPVGLAPLELFTTTLSGMVAATADRCARIMSRDIARVHGASAAAADFAFYESDEEDEDADEIARAEVLARRGIMAGSAFPGQFHPATRARKLIVSDIVRDRLLLQGAEPVVDAVVEQFAVEHDDAVEYRTIECTEALTKKELLAAFARADDLGWREHRPCIFHIRRIDRLMVGGRMEHSLFEAFDLMMRSHYTTPVVLVVTTEAPIDPLDEPIRALMRTQVIIPNDFEHGDGGGADAAAAAAAAAHA